MAGSAVNTLARVRNREYLNSDVIPSVKRPFTKNAPILRVKLTHTNATLAVPPSHSKAKQSKAEQSQAEQSRAVRERECSRNFN